MALHPGHENAARTPRKAARTVEIPVTMSRLAPVFHPNSPVAFGSAVAMRFEVLPSSTPASDEAGPERAEFGRPPATPARELSCEAMIRVYRRLRVRGLTARECDVVFWIGEGKRDAEIAMILGCAARTVNKHVQNLLRKLGVPTRLSAAYLARQWLAAAPTCLPPAPEGRDHDGERPGADGEDFSEPAFRRLVGIGLTARECSVLRWIVRGKRDAEIAELIGATAKSVNGHVSHLLKKLQAENRATAASIALAWLDRERQSDGEGVSDGEAPSALAAGAPVNFTFSCLTPSSPSLP